MSTSTSYAVFPTTEATRRLPQRLQRVSPYALTALAGLAAALPVIVAAIRAVAAGWLPTADQGIIATRAYDVFSAHSPLVGQYSMASGVAGHLTYDPGPLLYWLLALPARFGGPVALTVTMAAFNTAAIVGSVALARRRGGLPLMIAAAVAIALMSRSFGTEALHGIWNPAAGLFGLVLLSFLCWSLACGEQRLLPLTVLVASFVIQCHLAYIAPALGLLAVGLIGLAIVWRPRTRARASPPERPSGSLWRWVLAALLVALVCWSAPIVDEVSESPGNLSVLASAATAHHTTEGARVGWRALVKSVGIPPRWLVSPQRQVENPQRHQVGELSGGDYGDTRLRDVWSTPSTLATVSCLLIICGLAAVAVLSPLLRRGDLAAGAAVGLVLCAAFVWLASATPVSEVNTLGYTLWWGSLVGIWAWLMLLWSIAELVRSWAGALGRRGSGARPRTWLAQRAGARRLPAALAPTVALAAVIGAGGAVAALESADAHQAEFRALRAVTANLARSVPRGSTVLLTQRSFATIPLEPTVKYALRRQGVRVLASGAGLRLGSWYELGRRSYAVAVDLSEGDHPDIHPARVLTRVRLENAPWLPGGAGRHLITLSLARPPQRL